MKTNHILKGLEIVASSSGLGALFGLIFLSLHPSPQASRNRDLLADSLKGLLAAMIWGDQYKPRSRPQQSLNLQNMHELLKFLYRFSLLPATKRALIGGVTGSAVGLCIAYIKYCYDELQSENTAQKEENFILRTQLNEKNTEIHGLKNILQEQKKELAQCRAQLDEQARELAKQKEEKQFIRPACIFRKTASLSSLNGSGSFELPDISSASTSSPHSGQPFLGR